MSGCAMTEFTTREREILFYLLTKTEPIQIQEIAEALETSERTIQRERERLAQTVAASASDISVYSRSWLTVEW